MLNIPPGFSIDVPPGFTKAHCKLQIEAAAVSYADAPSSLILDAPPGFFTDILPGFTEVHRRLPGASSMGKTGKADEMKIMHNEVQVAPVFLNSLYFAFFFLKCLKYYSPIPKCRSFWLF